jgi:hypothetical protein
MSPAEVAELERLLDEALVLDPTEREAWLADGEPSWWRNVCARCCGRQTARHAAAQASSDRPDDAVAAGERVGPYQLVGRSVTAAWAACGWLNAPTVLSAAVA